MASTDEITTIHSSSMREDDLFDDMDNQPHPHNQSRLALCTSNSTYSADDDDDGLSTIGGGSRTILSRLSIESFDDEEFSDEKYGKDEILGGLSNSDSDDKEPAVCYSLPATPPRRRYTDEVAYGQLIGIGVKEYASENEAQKLMRKRDRRRRRRRRRRFRVERESTNWDIHSKKDVTVADDEEDMMTMMGMSMEMGGGIGGGWNNYNSSFSGESESGGLMVIAKPKGGMRPLCMDLEEVKACRDLGFELEQERMFEMMPSRLSLSASTLDTTSSGGNSPIANWRISSPGDDPRDVKARLKVWAQAVALASTSRHGC